MESSTPRDGDWSVEGPQTLEIEGVQSLDAGIVGGRIDVIVHQEPVVRVEVSAVHGPPLTLELRGGRLKLRHRDDGPLGSVGVLIRGIGRRGGARHEAVLSIAVPAGVPVRAATVDGDGLVCGVDADVELKTVSGSIMADDTQGRLRAATVSGEVIVRHHSGPLTAESVSGEVTASGWLEHVRAKTVSGDVAVDLLGEPRSVGVSAVSGDVTVRVPAASGVHVSARSTSGSITVGEQRFTGLAEKVDTHLGPSGGALELTATTVSGALAVFHRDEATAAG
ncbi:DUF4097 family beta strand repeat-containing protein [Zafaria sp. Z1313]|uniref:DUF4097 family beta strand repeat-containing protein n=1 Tax=Zafaria sp. Z1313 TaxID=3423202 RepID=UPI003D302D9F